MFNVTCFEKSCDVFQKSWDKECSCRLKSNACPAAIGHDSKMLQRYLIGHLVGQSGELVVNMKRRGLKSSRLALLASQDHV